MRFRESVVWITGASSGIGEALARTFHAEGARIVISARRAPELERLAAALSGDEAASADRIMVLPLDVTDEAAIGAATEAVLARFGRVDILVNNAGLTHRAPFEKSTVGVYREVMEVNYFGALMLTKAVLPAMIARGSGHIVAVSSVAGRYGSAMRSGYCAAKHAVEGLFESLREEVYARGIDVTVIVPGAVRTNVSINALQGDGSRYGRMDPFLENGMAPSECARRAVDAIYARRRDVLIATGVARRNVILKRLSPRLMSWVLRRRQRRGKTAAPAGKTA